MDLIYDAGILSSGDDRIRVPASVTVPANGSTTMRVSVSPAVPPHNVVQGWINLDGGDNNNLHFAYYAQVGAPQSIDRETNSAKQGRG